jgi:lysophospholipase L1-like esterase
MEVLVSVRRIVQYIRVQNPTCRIAICGLLPRPIDSKDPIKVNKLDDLNIALKADCALINVYFINTEKSIKGHPIKNVYREDGIHLTLEGVGYMKSYLEGIIGTVVGMPHNGTL